MVWRNKEEEKIERRQEQQTADKKGGEPGEKERKSWREIDAQRDGKRSGLGPTNHPRPAKGESPAYKAYKSKLSKLFDGAVKAGDGPQVEVVGQSNDASSSSLLAKKPASAPSPTRQPTAAEKKLERLMQTKPVVAVAAEAPSLEQLPPKERLKQAQSAAEITAAAQSCLAAGGLPKDTELLAKVLGVDDEELIAQTLDALLDACERGRPKNAKAIVVRLGELEGFLEDPVALDICRGLRARFN